MKERERETFIMCTSYDFQRGGRVSTPAIWECKCHGIPRTLWNTVVLRGKPGHSMYGFPGVLFSLQTPTLVDNNQG